jgi:uncharacterized protein YodC (DUF2158 family)
MIMPDIEFDKSVDQVFSEIADELRFAREKFPGKNVTFAACVEEVGELAKATFEEPAANVRKEAIQVAVMAIRMVVDGDHTFDAWRELKGLDRLGLACAELASNKCRVCGCTDFNCSSCVERTGQPCSWIEPDLCSACAEQKPDAEGPRTWTCADIANEGPQLGHTVRLKSGGPTMTVVGNYGELRDCAWFDINNEQQSEEFDYRCLVFSEGEKAPRNVVMNDEMPF